MVGRNKKKAPRPAVRQRDAESDTAEGPSGARPVIVAILFDRVDVSLESIEPALARQTILGKRTRAAPSERTGSSSDSFAVEIDGAIVAGMMMPAPYPTSELIFPIATAWTWPRNADAAVAASSAAHVVLVVTGGKGTPLENHLVATAVAALVAELPGALAVYWPAGRVIHFPALFAGMARELISPENPPLYLWANFGVEPNEDGSNTLFTAGMEALGAMDLEMHAIRRSPAELREWANSLHLYQLEHGPVFQAGDTIGEDEDGQLRVSHGASSFGLPGTVVHVDPVN